MTPRTADFLGDSAPCQLDQHGVHARHNSAALVANVDVAFREQPQHLTVPDRLKPTGPWPRADPGLRFRPAQFGSIPSRVHGVATLLFP
jgi:hypothetical protein